MMKDRLTLRDSHILKGLAILGVVLVHLLAQYPSNIFYGARNDRLFIVILDQLSRFSVPLFIAISGYGFAMKYHDSTVIFGKFLLSRIQKLIPLYIFWSAVFWIVLPLVPAWNTPDGGPTPYLHQLVFGYADYQMYFVPLIFQLYVLFPIIWKSFRKHPALWLALGMSTQVIAYSWFTHNIQAAPKDWQLFSSSMQYLIWVSWVGYFFLGMWLANPDHIRKLRKLPTAVWGVLAVILAGISIYSSLVAIHQGTDPLMALRFTRWSVLAYASITIVLGILFFTKYQLPALISSILNTIGKHSYLIFLSHTLAIRILMSARRETVPVTTLLEVTLVFLCAYFLSKKLQHFIDS